MDRGAAEGCWIMREAAAMCNTEHSTIMQTDFLQHWRCWIKYYSTICSNLFAFLWLSQFSLRRSHCPHHYTHDALARTHTLALSVSSYACKAFLFSSAVSALRRDCCLPLLLWFPQIFPSLGNIYFRLKMIGCFFPYTRRFFSAAFYWYSRTHTLTRGTLSAICFALSFAYTYLLATATLRLQFPRLPLASCSYYLFARESDLSRPRGPQFTPIGLLFVEFVETVCRVTAPRMTQKYFPAKQ